MRPFRRLSVQALAVCLALAVLAPGIARAQVPPELEATILLKVLSFDAALKTRMAKDTFLIAVLHPPDKASQGAAVAKALATLGSDKNLRLHGRAIRVVAVAMGDDFAQRVSGAGALYASAGLDSRQLAAIAKLAEARQLPTLCASRAYLSNGIAIAIVAKDDKPKIIIHAVNVKRSGMLLDSKLLRVAELVR